MAEHDKNTTTLNTLIATLLDSVDGYTKAAQDCDNRELADRFNSRARERQSAVAGLQAAVASLGGNPEDDGTVLAGAHRVFLNLKEAITGRDDKAIVTEVERGEDYLKAKFEAARDNVDLAPQARAAVDAAWTSVKSGHDEMSQLKHTWEGYEAGREDASARTQEYASETARTGTRAPGGSETY